MPNPAHNRAELRAPPAHRAAPRHRLSIARGVVVGVILGVTAWVFLGVLLWLVL
jgi:hypothetical protein